MLYQNIKVYPNEIRSSQTAKEIYDSFFDELESRFNGNTDFVIIDGLEISTECNNSIYDENLLKPIKNQKPNEETFFQRQFIDFVLHSDNPKLEKVVFRESVSVLSKTYIVELVCNTITGKDGNEIGFSSFYFDYAAINLSTNKPSPLKRIEISSNKDPVAFKAIFKKIDSKKFRFKGLDDKILERESVKAEDTLYNFSKDEMSNVNLDGLNKQGNGQFSIKYLAPRSFDDRQLNNSDMKCSECNEVHGLLLKGHSYNVMHYNPNSNDSLNGLIVHYCSIFLTHFSEKCPILSLKDSK